MFQALISPIFRSTRLCVTAYGIMHPRCCLEAEFLRFQATGRQHRGCIIPQAVTHSLVILKMGEINAWNMLSWMELLRNRYCCILLVFISFSSRLYCPPIFIIQRLTSHSHFSCFLSHIRVRMSLLSTENKGHNHWFITGHWNFILIHRFWEFSK